jgi:peptidoglycan/xylan/chitin deacetylase (PgdA/CDA1 family)
MRVGVTRSLLAVLLAVSMGGTVFAQGRSDDDVFGWPLDEWQRASEGLAAEAELPPNKTLPSPKMVRKGPRSSGAVALTFDDGYDAKACASIANTLRRYDAVGTFFINGQWIRREPNRWRRILEGMEVGNHTRSHPYLTAEPHPVVINQIRSNEWIHEQALGRPMLKVLRPPYGAYGERVGRIAKQLGYDHIVMWSVDTGDWKPNAKAKQVVRRAIDAPPGSIILMHCGPRATAKAMPRIVRHYQRRGIEVAGLSDVIKGAKGTRADPETEFYGESP